MPPSRLGLWGAAARLKPGLGPGRPRAGAGAGAAGRALVCYGSYSYKRVPGVWEMAGPPLGELLPPRFSGICMEGSLGPGCENAPPLRERLLIAIAVLRSKLLIIPERFNLRAPILVPVFRALIFKRFWHVCGEYDAVFGR